MLSFVRTKLKSHVQFIKDGNDEVTKGEDVYVIHLLVVFGKYKNIVDVGKSTSFINFNQTKIRIYPNSTIGIIPIAF